jgi:O-antigen ligase
MTRFSAVVLFLLLIATVSVMWVGEKWATSIPEIGGFVLAAIWVTMILANRFEARLSIVMVPLACIVAWGGLQLASGSTVYGWPTRLAILYWAGNLAWFFCGLQTFRDKEIRAGFLRALLFFGFVLAIFSVVQALTSLDKVYWHYPTPFYIGAVFGPFLYKNQFCAFLELLLPVALYSAMTSRRHKLLYYLYVATFYAAVIAAASRAGFFFASVELAVVPMLVLRKRSLSRTQVINGALVLVGMLLWLAIPAGPDVLISRFGPKDQLSARREFNESSLEMIRDRPVMGVGLGNWSTAYPGYAKFDDGNFANQAHDDWAQWTAEGGIPMLVMMLGVAVWGGMRALRSVWGLGVLAIFFHCTVDYPIQRPGVAIVFFLMMAAIADAGRREPDGAAP